MLAFEEDTTHELHQIKQIETAKLAIIQSIRQLGLLNGWDQEQTNKVSDLTSELHKLQILESKLKNLKTK